MGLGRRDATQQRLSRRAFLNRVWAGLGVLSLIEVVAVMAAYFRPRAPKRSAAGPDPVVVAGPVERFEPGSVQTFVQGRFYLARLEDGGFLALARNCTHLNCAVPWVADEGPFVCPCHASAFDIRGAVIIPPAPRALDLYAVTIENGMVRVDAGRRRRRAAFAADQVAYPESR